MSSLKVAEKLKESRLKEADQMQQQQNTTTIAQQPASSAPSAVDQAQLEKAFEAALQTVKGEIVKEVQGLMEKFGEALVQKLIGAETEQSSSSSQMSETNNSNSGQPQEENTDGNK